MSLPSKYAPQGISDEDSRRTITIGKKPQVSPHYIVRRFEQKVDDADKLWEDGDKLLDEVEMMDIDYDEAYMISDYVTASRLNEIMSYDIDITAPPTQDGPIHESPHHHDSYLIIDTNFALSNLKLINDIKDLAPTYNLKIIIPMTTMSELDGLKQSKKIFDDKSHDQLTGKTIGILARWANDWIFNQMAQDNIVKGQKLNQRIDKMAKKDDAILDCCIYFKQYYQHHLIVLCSNDKNLCMKALSNDILTVSFNRDMNANLICKTIYQESVSKFGGGPASQPTVNNIPIDDAGPTIITQHDMDMDNPMTDEDHHHTDHHHTTTTNGKLAINHHQVGETIYHEIFVLTKSIIHHAMVEIFGDDLDIIRDYNPSLIHDMSDCHDIILKYWLSVFSGLVTINQREIRNFDHYIPVSKHEVMNFVNDWRSLLSELYEKLLDDHQVNALHKMYIRWDKLLSQLS